MADSSPSSSPSPPVKRRCILVCQYRSCERNYSPEVLAALRALAPPGVLISSSGCLGQCASGPTVQVMPDQVWYCRVRPEDAADIVEQHILGDRPVSRLLHPRFHPDGVSADEAESGGDRQEIPTATD